MPFFYDLSDELKVVLRKLSRKNPELAKATYKKIHQIVDLNDEITIDHFKNLRHGLSVYKRVHVARSFMLLFRVLKEQNFILFVRLEHHDNVYDRK